MMQRGRTEGKKDKRPTSNIERPTSNEKTPNLVTFPGYPGSDE